MEGSGCRAMTGVMTLDSFSVRIGESLQIWKTSKLFTPLTETDPLSSHIGKNPPTLPSNTVSALGNTAVSAGKRRKRWKPGEIGTMGTEGESKERVKKESHVAGMEQIKQKINRHLSFGW